MWDGNYPSVIWAALIHKKTQGPVYEHTGGGPEIGITTWALFTLPFFKCSGMFCSFNLCATHFKRCLRLAQRDRIYGVKLFCLFYVKMSCLMGSNCSMIDSSFTHRHVLSICLSSSAGKNGYLGYGVIWHIWSWYGEKTVTLNWHIILCFDNIFTG